MPRRRAGEESIPATLPPEIAESEAVMALIERGKAEGRIAGDDVRRAFEADRIPATRWKSVLRSLNQILEDEGVTLMVGAAEPPKRPRDSVAAKSPVKRTATATATATDAVTAESASVAKTAAQAGAVPDSPARDDVARWTVPAELSDVGSHADAPAASRALWEGIERLFRELGPPPGEEFSGDRSELGGGGGSAR